MEVRRFTAGALLTQRGASLFLVRKRSPSCAFYSTRRTMTTTAAQTAASNKDKQYRGKQGVLAAHMKEMEQTTVQYLRADQPVIIRLDGHRFSIFAKHWKKPFDERISRAMVRTAVDVAEAFHARAAYTFSDEISLILAANQDIHNKDPNNPLNPFIFGGKVPKIITLAAGLASTRFNWHIANEQYGSCEQEQKRHQRATEGSAHFDARAFNLPDYETCLDNIIWRGLDCLRNSKTGLARCYFSAKQLHDRSSAEMVAMLKQEHGVDWNTYPDHFKTGLLIKKKAVLKEMIHPITNAPITVTRKNFFCIGWENVRRLSRNDATTLLLTPLLQEDNQHPINQHQEHHTNATQYAVDEDNDDEEEEEESNKKQANGVVYTNRSRSLSQVLPLFTPIDYTPHR